MKKIPDNATKVFEGIVFDVFHWEQAMFDGSTETFEAIRKKPTVTVVATVGDKVIITDEEQPGYEPFRTLPGGRVEEGETALENAKRELAEETGYTSEDWQEWFVSDPWHAPKIDWDNHFLIARNCQKTQEQELDAGEKIRVNLVTFDEFLDFRNNPKSRNKDLCEILEKASRDPEERKKLQELLFAPTTN